MTNTLGKFETAPGNWWQVNILNAFGRPPDSATISTGNGTVNVTDLWRDEGTFSTVTSDQGIFGTVRIKVDTVQPFAFDQTTVNEMHIRVKVGGLNSNVQIYLKNDSGAFVAVATVPVTGTLTVNEVHLALIGTQLFSDYIDANGNITVRVEVPGPLQFQYDVNFDQLLVRTLRASESL